MMTNRQYLPGIALPGFVAILFFSLVISGCATAPPTMPTSPMSPAIYQQLLAYNQWHINGKLGYRDLKDGGSAWVDWQQNGDQFELNLRGPFGAGATQIKGADDYAILSQAGEAPIKANSATLLTETLFGWPWPVDELLFWIKGIPATHSAVDLAIYDDNHLLTQLQQSGWQLQFSNYQTNPDGLILPGRITGQFQQVSFTLLIKQWIH